MVTVLGYALASTFIFAGSTFPVQLKGEWCHPSRLIIQLQDNPMARFSATAFSDVDVVRDYPEIGLVSVSTKGRSPLLVRNQLLKNPAIKNVFFDRVARTAYIPNDPMWPGMWHATAIKAHLAWDLSQGSNQAVVAILDTGVKTDHEDLAANIWINAGEIAGNGVDDDANGYIDDINGYDFAYGDAIPNDVNGHGTACAGLAAGIIDNAKGAVGVAPKARIMCLKPANDSGYFYDTENIAAYLYAANNGAHVISMSYFSDRVSTPERIALEYCVTKGILPVAAAGNDNTVFSYYPAAHEVVVAVAALNTDLSRAGFSIYGSWVDVASPGVQLRTSTNNGGYTEGFAGTSGACPQVAGLAALIKGAHPTFTPESIRRLIEDTAVPTIQAPMGEYTNYGRIDAQAAMQAAQTNTTIAKSPLVRWISPMITSLDNSFGDTTTIYGRGFGKRSVRVFKGGVQGSVESKTRDYVTTQLPVNNGAITVYVDNNLIFTSPAVITLNRDYPLIEASTKGASLTGGFLAALAPNDNRNIEVTRRSDGLIFVQGTFRKLSGHSRLTFELKRSYTGGTAGTEVIKLYDWSTASFPYGSFVTLSSTAISQVNGGTALIVNVPNASRFADLDGTAYLQIETSGTSEGTKLNIDQCRLKVR